MADGSIGAVFSISRPLGAACAHCSPMSSAPDSTTPTACCPMTPPRWCRCWRSRTTGPRCAPTTPARSWRCARSPSTSGGPQPPRTRRQSSSATSLTKPRGRAPSSTHRIRRYLEVDCSRSRRSGREPPRAQLLHVLRTRRRRRLRRLAAQTGRAISANTRRPTLNTVPRTTGRQDERHP